MALLRAVQSALKSYPTSSEADEKLLAHGIGGRPLGHRRRCAVLVRWGEKRLLQRLKAELTALVSVAADFSATMEVAEEIE